MIAIPFSRPNFAEKKYDYVNIFNHLTHIQRLPPR
jgi:hypothetical protein